VSQTTFDAEKLRERGPPATTFGGIDQSPFAGTPASNDVPPSSGTPASSSAPASMGGVAVIGGAGCSAAAPLLLGVAGAVAVPAALPGSGPDGANATSFGLPLRWGAGGESLVLWGNGSGWGFKQPTSNNSSTHPAGCRRGRADGRAAAGRTLGATLPLRPSRARLEEGSRAAQRSGSLGGAGVSASHPGVRRWDTRVGEGAGHLLAGLRLLPSALIVVTE